MDVAFALAVMTVISGKRKSKPGDGTDGDDQNSSLHPAKSSRVAPTPDQSNTSYGQRFGENVEYIPLSQLPFSQLTQTSANDDDDAQAADVAPSSQDLDDASVNTFAVYGMVTLITLTLLEHNQFDLDRHPAHEDCGCPLL